MATIAEEISALRGRISQAYDVIDQKGGDVPFDRTSWNLSASIDSIRTGGEEGIVPIRYLESDGNQYINTGRGMTNYENTRPIIDMKGEFIYGENSSDLQALYGALRQSGTSYPNTNQFQFDRTGATNIFRLQNCGTLTTLTATGAEYVPHDLHINGQPNCWWQVDRRSGTYATTASQTYSPQVHLFGVSLENSGTTIHGNNGPCRIYYFQHKQSNVMMTDMIPVRIGTTGYMFNKATGRLHGNLGTGDFILGPDIDFTIPGATRVSWLGFTGTQWIDTGLHGTQDTYIELDFLGEANNGAVVFGYRKDNTPDGQNISIMQSTTSLLVDFGGTASTTRFTIANTTLSPAQRRVVRNYRGGREVIPYYMGINMTMQNTGIYTGTFTQEGTMWLGKGGDGYSTSGLTEMFKGQVYHLEIHEKGRIVMDLWPCSKNGVGMFYDLITGNFFENQGTGDFVLGPDVG